MDARAAFLGPALAAALADVPARRVLDVAGGSGAYARALVDRAPGLSATVFERPPVDAEARALLAECGYRDRMTVTSGDMSPRARGRATARARRCHTSDGASGTEEKPRGRDERAAAQPRDAGLDAGRERLGALACAA